MRLLPIPLLLGLFLLSGAQTGSVPPDSQSLFSTLVPDATISIKKHPFGPDMVEMTMTAAGYPAKLVESQIRSLGAFMHAEPRGVQVGDFVLDPANPDSRFTKAQFVLDGVIDRKAGSVRLNPFIQALAGAPKPWTIHAVEFQFEGEVPTDKMIKNWWSKSARVEGRFEDSKDPRLAGIEFRVKLLTQDPAKIDIPEPGDGPVTVQKKLSAAAGTDWMTIAVFLVAAGAVGALVYSLLLKARPKGRI